LNRLGWMCVEAAARMLEPRDREAVLGDLTEVAVGFWGGLSDVLGLALRRQARLWTSWRPWAASVGLAWPASLFLMGNSVAVSGTLLHGGQWRDGLWQLVLLSIWALAAGFTVSSISQKTIWASALACALPYCFCLSLWPGSWLGALRLLLFIVPALVGAWLGSRQKELAHKWAMAAALVGLWAPVMGSVHGGWYELGVIWPSLYLYSMILARRGEWAPASWAEFLGIFKI